MLRARRPANVANAVPIAWGVVWIADVLKMEILDFGLPDRSHVQYLRCSSNAVSVILRYLADGGVVAATGLPLS